MRRRFPLKMVIRYRLKSFRLHFFKEKLEVQADTECFETTLLPERQEEEYFEGFPFYKRSPRVVYQRKEESGN